MTSILLRWTNTHIAIPQPSLDTFWTGYPFQQLLLEFSAWPISFPFYAAPNTTIQLGWNWILIERVLRERLGIRLIPFQAVRCAKGSGKEIGVILKQVMDKCDKRSIWSDEPRANKVWENQFWLALKKHEVPLEGRPIVTAQHYENKKARTPDGQEEDVPDAVDDDTDEQDRRDGQRVFHGPPRELMNIRRGLKNHPSMKSSRPQSPALTSWDIEKHLAKSDNMSALKTELPTQSEAIAQIDTYREALRQRISNYKSAQLTSKQKRLSLLQSLKEKDKANLEKERLYHLCRALLTQSRQERKAWEELTRVDEEKRVMKALKLDRESRIEALRLRTLEESLERERILVQDAEKEFTESQHIVKIQLEEVKRQKQLRRLENVRSYCELYVRSIAEQALMIAEPRILQLEAHEDDWFNELLSCFKQEHRDSTVKAADVDLETMEYILCEGKWANPNQPLSNDALVQVACKYYRPKVRPLPTWKGLKVVLLGLPETHKDVVRKSLAATVETPETLESCQEIVKEHGNYDDTPYRPVSASPQYSGQFFSNFLGCKPRPPPKTSVHPSYSGYDALIYLKCSEDVVISRACQNEDEPSIGLDLALNQMQQILTWWKERFNNVREVDAGREEAEVVEAVQRILRDLEDLKEAQIASDLGVKTRDVASAESSEALAVQRTEVFEAVESTAISLLPAIFKWRRSAQLGLFIRLHRYRFRCRAMLAHEEILAQSTVRTQYLEKVGEYVQAYNAWSDEMRSDNDVKGEMHVAVKGLEEGLWQLADVSFKETKSRLKAELTGLESYSHQLMQSFVALLEIELRIAEAGCGVLDAHFNSLAEGLVQRPTRDALLLPERTNNGCWQPAWEFIYKKAEEALGHMDCLPLKTSEESAKKDDPKKKSAKKGAKADDKKEGATSNRSNPDSLQPWQDGQTSHLAVSRNRLARIHAVAQSSLTNLDCITKRAVDSVDQWTQNRYQNDLKDISAIVRRLHILIEKEIHLKGIDISSVGCLAEARGLLLAVCPDDVLLVEDPGISSVYIPDAVEANTLSVKNLIPLIHYLKQNSDGTFIPTAQVCEALRKSNSHVNFAKDLDAVVDPDQWGFVSWPKIVLGVCYALGALTVPTIDEVLRLIEAADQAGSNDISSASLEYWFEKKVPVPELSREVFDTAYGAMDSEYLRTLLCVEKSPEVGLDRLFRAHGGLINTATLSQVLQTFTKPCDESMPFSVPWLERCFHESSGVAGGAGGTVAFPEKWNHADFVKRIWTVCPVVALGLDYALMLEPGTAPGTGNG